MFLLKPSQMQKWMFLYHWTSANLDAVSLFGFTPYNAGVVLSSSEKYMFKNIRKEERMKNCYYKAVHLHLEYCLQMASSASERVM